MDKKIVDNFKMFLQYTQRNYENKFKFVPLTKTKQCFVKGHTKVEVGLWNSRGVDLNTTINELNKLSNDIHGIGIHSSSDVVILDIDSIVSDDGTHKKLTEVQKDYLINKFQTLAQKTKGGVHLFFNNDIDIKVATTGLNFDFGNSKIKYDVRGVGKAYVGVKDIVNGFSLNELKQISTFQKLFNLDPKQEQKIREYLIDDEKLSEFFEVPKPEIYEEDEKKFYALENVLNGKTLKQLEEDNYAEGNRYPTFTQIALRGAGIGINYNVIQDIILRMNSNLAEALNEKRLDGVFKITNELKNNYAKYEQQRTSIKQTHLLPNLRMKITDIKSLEFSKEVQGYSIFKDGQGKTYFTNYDILIDNLDYKVKVGDIVDIKISECKFTTSYEQNGEKIKLDNPKYKGKGFSCEVKNENTPKKLFGLSVEGEINNEIKEDNFNNYVTLVNDDRFINLKFDKSLKLELNKGNYCLPLSNFETNLSHEGKYYSNGRLAKKTVLNLENFLSKKQQNQIQFNTQKEQQKPTFNTQQNTVESITEQPNFNVHNSNIEVEIPFNMEPPMENYNEVNNYNLDMQPLGQELSNQGEEIKVTKLTNNNQIVNTTTNISQNTVKEFKPQLPNLRMRIGEVKKFPNFTAIKGYVSRMNKNTNKWDTTKYDVIVSDLKYEVKPKDVVDISLRKLEYTPTYIDKNGNEQNSYYQFKASGNNLRIKNEQSKDQMLGVSISGVLHNNNGKLAIKDDKTNLLIINNKFDYPNFEAKDVTIPITTFNVDYKNKTTECGIKLSLEKCLRFNRTETKKQENNLNMTN